ncbi:MAG: sugar kinase [Saprospiraceae bacterium]|nr:sugar kinase [Saprospiraceae bacterium]
MINDTERQFDICCAGELLIDFISEAFADDLDAVSQFRRIQGGSPANLCMNMSRLGNRAALVATVGQDDMGQFLLRAVEGVGVNCTCLASVPAPTTLILVTRSRTVSNFEAHRSADCQITFAQLPDALLAGSRIFHTTCFALSLEPAQSAILDAAQRAAALGCQLSIDANYAQKIWADREQAQAVVAAYCAHGALVKVSEVDWERLYGNPMKDPQAASDHFLALGAKEVCVTLGGEGCLAATASTRLFLPARPVQVKDTTGAGDAFWSGYLSAWLDGRDLENCAKAGRRMAEIKLGYFGSLPNVVEREAIYTG